jgi:hypothetical protein
MLRGVPGICDRCALRWKRSQLRAEYIDNVRTGLLVCPDCYDGTHPQDLPRPRTIDKQMVKDPRPDKADEESRSMGGWNPVYGMDLDLLLGRASP